MDRILQWLLNFLLPSFNAPAPTEDINEDFEINPTVFDVCPYCKGPIHIDRCPGEDGIGPFTVKR